jgi:hypothetical protein
VLTLAGAHLRDGGKLGDLAPTVLGLLGIAPTPEMTGQNLLLYSRRVRSSTRSGPRRRWSASRSRRSCCRSCSCSYAICVNCA